MDEKRRSTANSEMKQILELSDKDFKAAITKKCSYVQLKSFPGQIKIRALWTCGTVTKDLIIGFSKEEKEWGWGGWGDWLKNSKK